MAAVESWIEKQFQGSSTQRSLEMVSVTMGIRGAGKAASELANIDILHGSILTHCLCHEIHTAQHIHIYGTQGRRHSHSTDEPLQPDTQPDPSGTSTHSWCIPQSLGDIWLLPGRRPPTGS